jgi:UDP-N-acetylmuramyl pentapeptide synthase
MAELGASAPGLHESIGMTAASIGIDELHCGGPFAAELAAGARAGGMPAAAVTTFASNEAIADLLRRTLRAGDYVLLKGSRVEKMEEILQGVLAPGILAS